MNTNILSEWKRVTQRSDAWYLARRQILTASEVSSVLEVSPYETKYELFKRKVTERLNQTLLPNDEVKQGNAATQWGEKHEPLARQLYESLPLANGQRNVHEVGLVRHQSLLWLGASPDGVVESERRNADGSKNWWLLEIKCPFRRTFHEEDNKGIPLYIWVQVQIQLEVCNIPFCHLFQCRYTTTETYESRLLNRKLTTINRNPKWFNEIALPQLKEFWNLVLRSERYQYVPNPYPNPKEWVSMKSFTGYLLDDPILDWLDMYQDHEQMKLLGEPEWSETFRSRRKQKIDLNKSLFQSIHEFSSARKEMVLQITPSEEKDREALSSRRALQTEKALRKNIPVVLRPVIMDKQSHVYGIADMVVRCDTALAFLRRRYPLSKLFGIRHLEKQVAENRAFPGYIIFCFTLRKPPREDAEEDEYSDPEFKFVQQFPEQSLRRSLRQQALRRKKQITVSDDDVEIEDIDMKDSDEEDNENNEDIEIKESRISRTQWDKVLCTRYGLYSRAINRSFSSSVVPQTLIAFLGSGFCHVINPTRYEEMEERGDDAIHWMDRVKKEGKEWADHLVKGRTYPASTRLYPNMCNRYDQRWRKIKTTVAERWGELTLLWYCGRAQRDRAHSRGVYSWRDDDLPPEDVVQSLLAKKKSKKLDSEEHKSRRRRVMEAMIELNRTKDKIFDAAMIGEFEEPWLEPKRDIQEFFVDFEIIPRASSVSTMSSPRLQQPDGMVYLIGMGWTCPVTKKWEFRSFVASALTVGAEEKTLQSWWDCIDTVMSKTYALKAVMYHWSPAEPRFFNTAINRHSKLRYMKEAFVVETHEWRDLMEMFLEAEVVIRDVWGYSIKDIAKGLHKYGMLQEVWAPGEKGGDHVIECGEGTLATATGCYRNAFKDGINVNHLPKFESLRTYNEIDCRVVYDLLCFMREHIYAPSEESSDDESNLEASPLVGKSMETVWGHSLQNIPSLLILDADIKDSEDSAGNGDVDDTEDSEDGDNSLGKRKHKTKSQRSKKRRKTDKL